MDTSYNCFAGIDVSLHSLDAHVLPADQARRFPNSADGRRELAGFLKAGKVQFIVLESTGGYERLATLALIIAGMDVHVAQPQIIHAFAVSLGLRAKNDKIDAAICARFAQDRWRDLPIKSMDQTQDKLRSLVGRRQDLVKHQTEEQNRLKQALQQGLDKETVRSIKNMLALLGREIKRVEKAIDAAIASDDELAAKAKALREIKGVGVQTARIVVAALPELGKIDSKSVNSLVGVAPYAVDSGDRKKTRHITGGRMLVRNVLYMACLTAVFKNPVIKPHYDKMIGRGLPHKSAMMACIRQLLAHMNTKIRLLLESRAAAVA